jgi:hypothetical protein
MTVLSTPTTFADLTTDAANRLRVNASESVTLNILRRYVNQGLHDVHIQQNWPWAERKGMIQTHASYTDGTVSIATSARTTVTGASTLWNTTVTGMGFTNARAGGKIMFAGSSEVYTVSTVNSDTSITLVDRYIGDTLSAASYVYFEDEYALASDYWRTLDVRKFSSDSSISIIARQEFYRRYSRNSTLNTPQICTIIDLGPGATVAPQLRVVFHPVPERIYNIPYRYITTNLAVSSAGVGSANLVSDTDEPIIPLRYRHCLVFYAIAQWYRDRKDDTRSQEANGEYVDVVRRMAGDAFPSKDHPRFVSNRMDYARGAAGPGRRGRYGTGTSFNEMRDF